MKWLVWILIFGLVACATMPEHRPQCEPVPTTGGHIAGWAAGILTFPIGVIVILPIMYSTEKNRLIRAYPECKDKAGPGLRDLHSCVREIDSKEGRIQEPAPSPPPKQAP